MAVKRLGPSGRAVDVGRAHWGGGDHLGYGGPATVMARETARPVVIEPKAIASVPNPAPEKKKTIKTKADKEDAISINIRIPVSIINHYKQGGRGYQTRIVEDLKNLVDSRRGVRPSTA